MALRAHSLTAMLLIAGLAAAPVAQAREVHPHARHYHYSAPARRYYGPVQHGGGDAAAAAIIGGLIGLGIGAAIGSGGGYPPPTAYYGAPPGYYAPPGVYYGY